MTTQRHGARRQLRIADTVSLPIDAVTETFAIMAKRGVGKTYTGLVLAEEMLGIGAQIAVLDPLDVWWGLRSSVDGKGEGLPIYAFGGEHGDLPLEPTAGALLADTVVDHGISAILSLRHLSKEKQRSFVTAFAERLYHRKGEPSHRTPLHVFFDEADAFVPQRVMGDSARMVGAVDDIIRRGRNAGLGGTLISQRPAVVNKDVLSQCEVLIALRTIDTRDRKALMDWIEAHDVEGHAPEFMASLASLAVGEAWVWSPGWLDIFTRARIRARRTFDSSRTPKAGERATVPVTRAKVNLESLGAQIAASVEQAKANDPAELRRRIASLEATVRSTPAPVEVPVVREVEVFRDRDVPVLSPADRDALIHAADRLAEIGGDVRTAAANIVRALGPLTAIPGPRPVAPAIPPAAPSPVSSPTARRNPERRTEASVSMGAAEVSASSPTSLGKAERSILTALATYPIGLSRSQLAFLANYHPRAKGFTNALGTLRTAGLVTPDFPEALTDAGRAIASPERDAFGSVLETWMGRFGRAERAILEHLIALYPATADREALAPIAGFEHVRSKGYTNAVGRLRGLGLVDGYGLDPSFAQLLGR